MKLTCSEQAKLPQERLWSQLTDPVTLAHGIGAKSIVAPSDVPEVGDTWQAHFARRGFPRTVPMRLEQCQPQDCFQISGTARGLLARLSFHLQPRHMTTDVKISLEFLAQGMRGRVLLKSVALAGHGLDSRFQTHVRQFIVGIEAREAQRPTRSAN